MSDQPQPPRKPISEISHLFLSSMRDQPNQPRPRRTPPASQRPAESIDMTPEEFAKMVGDSAPAEREAPVEYPPRRVPIAAVIAPHLNGQQIDRVRQYAASLAGDGARVGLIIVDASEFRLMSFEPGNQSVVPNRAIQTLDSRRMGEALTELHEDIDRWLVCLPSPRGPEAKAVLKKLPHWIMLATCDHDGVVSGYRTLKGLCDVAKPRLSVALLDAQDTAAAQKVARKLNHAALQFLGWELDADAVSERPSGYAEHAVLWCRATTDKAQLAAAPQWDVLGKFIGTLRGEEAPAGLEAVVEDEQLLADSLDEETTVGAEPIHAPAPLPMPPRPMTITPAPEPTPMKLTSRGRDEVIDLADADDAASIVTAIVGSDHEFATTSIKPPMCAAASVCVARDGTMTLVAATEAGLAGLRDAAKAYQWLSENRRLVAMALPQFAVKVESSPKLTLLIDVADLSADLLQPLVAASNVSVRAYRKLRWGERRGLLLEAA